MLVASDNPAEVAAAARARDCQVLRWPDDGPRLVEQHWDEIGPVLDALTEQTGVRRLSPDEAAGLPGVSTIAVMLTLLDESRRQVLVGDAIEISGLVSAVSNLCYGERRLLPMPLDVLASMNRKLRPIAAMGVALSVSGRLLGQLRERGRWAAVVDADGERGARCIRHLSLAGIDVLAEGTSPGTALADGFSHTPRPWLAVERDGDEYQLLIRAPGLTKDSMMLSRAGDDLVVTVDGFAHPVELPNGLRRCAVIGGTVTEGGVHIRFRPERGKWRD